MAVCFTPGQVGASGRIVQEYSAYVETVVQEHYCLKTGGCFKFTRPSNGGTEFFDEPTKTTRCRFLGEFLKAHHPGLDVDFVVQACEARKKAVDPDDEDDEPFPVPDIITHRPTRKEVYEIKPRNAAGRKDAKDKLDRFLGMTDFLSATVPTTRYQRGTLYRPDESFVLYDAPITVFGQVKVVLHVVGEGQGVILHEICVESLLTSPEAKLAIKIVLGILFLVLLRRGLRGAPVGAPTPALAWSSPLEQGVGRNRPNAPRDVRYVQVMLNESRRLDGVAAIGVDGLVGPETIGAVEDFQTAVTGIVDGAVDVGGPAINALERSHADALVAAMTLSDVDGFDLSALTGYPPVDEELPGDVNAIAQEYIDTVHARA
ncbi:peptidoglycan-binding protein [Streptomyces sp. 8K308]|uniref:peptidoglycan-binding domain-containing protein n=1 Tax=Streptomyces sp. 8K308 TaxID=2530388 RepID=UPI001048035B|nr:peptidoglycan-binding domain-containing protein [Streptomyces sp. 8K308]TDC19319.1 peptidoglycan-binding protein [Streptomyces sp. 8K308]